MYLAPLLKDANGNFTTLIAVCLSYLFVAYVPVLTGTKVFVPGAVLLLCPHVCIWHAHHHQANKIVCCSGPSCFHAVFVRTADKTLNANQDVCLVVQGITCAVCTVLQ